MNFMAKQLVTYSIDTDVVLSFSRIQESLDSSKSEIVERLIKRFIAEHEALNNESGENVIGQGTESS